MVKLSLGYTYSRFRTVMGTDELAIDALSQGWPQGFRKLHFEDDITATYGLS